MGSIGITRKKRLGGNMDIIIQVSLGGNMDIIIQVKASQVWGKELMVVNGQLEVIGINVRTASAGDFFPIIHWIALIIH